MLFASLLTIPANANGVLRWGFGAGDLGAAGAFGMTSGSALNGLQTNPAILTDLGNELAFSARLLRGKARFAVNGEHYGLRDARGVYPDLAVSWQSPRPDLVFGLGVSPISGLEANWLYPDAPGGLGGISYGTLPHQSRYSAVRISAGAGYRLRDNLSLGVTLGAVRADMVFDAPFIFQSNPALQGAKVDLDLEAHDWAPSTVLGLTYRLSDCWTLGLQITPPLSFDLKGKARADFSAQLPDVVGNGDSMADYGAVVGNELPLSVALGTEWQATDRLKLGARLDWIQWSQAYDSLPVTLTGGSNNLVNDAIGADVWDRVPLEWRDRFVIALGARYEINESWSTSAGWRYAKSPIPEALVTPLNGSILERAVTVGVGWKNDDWSVDFAWAHEFSPRIGVGASGYRAGEYSDSSLEVEVDHFSLGVRRFF